MIRYLDEIKIGETSESRREYLSKEKILKFAHEFDPQPMHLDEEAAKETFFETLVASGWHMASLTMRLMVDTAPLGGTPLIGATIRELKFAKKVLPDITVYAQSEVTGIKDLPSRPFGLVEMTIETRDDQSGDLLLSQYWSVVVPKKGADHL